MAERNRLTREESPAQTRARLLESAAAVFAQRGFYGASVEEIAERAGFSRGAFYSNFEDKSDLFLALLDDRLERELRAVEETLADEAGPGAFLDLLRRGGGRRSEPKEWTLLWAEFWLHVMRHPELAPKLAARQQAMRAAVARLVENQCRQLGITLPVPAEELASVMLAVDDGLKLQEDLDPTAVPEDLRVRILIVLLRGLATQTQPG
ncbi:MAG: TetR/AcrR family transcriptional regulator [Actinomycetota bacterium]|nr:TetR/AcrR family transcriptional regulator [Actinomycetota bacterium]